MRKMFAPLALLFGLLTALMLGSTAVAQANPILPNFVCSNGGVVGVVTCIDNRGDVNVLNDFTVKITDNNINPRVLTNNELTILKNNLNNTQIDLLNITATILNLKNVTVNVYDNFSPSIDIGLK